MYWLVLLDDYSASFGLMVVVITTCLAVTRVYGEKGHRVGWGEVWAGGKLILPGVREQGAGPVLQPGRETGMEEGSLARTEPIMGTLLLLPWCRHPAVLPRHPHDAGLQARPLLQGLLAVSVSSHTLGNQGLERGGGCLGL